MRQLNNQIWKTMMALVVLLLVAILLVACGGASQPEPTAAPPAATEAPAAEPTEAPAAALPDVCRGQDGTGLKVGFGNLGESVPFAVSVREGIEEVAADCNLEVVNADNALDPQLAVDNARLFMTQNVDGIIEFNVHGNIADSICEIVGDTPMIAIDIAHPGCS
ncbi:MAG: hypothetical protein J5I90_03690, partial [Caldilineales bacterium]|nr:hypothetical protein [Caldilineales bacterium]